MFNLNFIKPLNLTSSLHKVQEMKKKKLQDIRNNQVNRKGATFYRKTDPVQKKLSAWGKNSGRGWVVFHRMQYLPEIKRNEVYLYA